MTDSIPLGMYVPSNFEQKIFCSEAHAVINLMDHTQQIPLWAFNDMDVPVRLELFADRTPKEVVILEPKAHQEVLIMTCLPKFKDMADQSRIVWFKGVEYKYISGNFSLLDDPSETTRVYYLYKFFDYS